MLNNCSFTARMYADNITGCGLSNYSSRSVVSDYLLTSILLMLHTRFILPMYTRRN